MPRTIIFNFTASYILLVKLQCIV